MATIKSWLGAMFFTLLILYFGNIALINFNNENYGLDLIVSLFLVVVSTAILSDKIKNILK